MYIRDPFKRSISARMKFFLFAIMIATTIRISSYSSTLTDANFQNQSIEIKDSSSTGEVKVSAAVQTESSIPTSPSSPFERDRDKRNESSKTMKMTTIQRSTEKMCNFSYDLDHYDLVCTNHLQPHVRMYSDEFICSKNKRYRFGMTIDKKLCMCDRENQKLWCVDDNNVEKCCSFGYKPYTVLTKTGLLAVYNTDDEVRIPHLVWSSSSSKKNQSTSGRKKEKLIAKVTNEGDLQIIDSKQNLYFASVNEEGWQRYSYFHTKEKTKQNLITKHMMKATLTLAGRREDGRPNQDRTFIMSPFQINGDDDDQVHVSDPNKNHKSFLLGIFDGHGARGEEVSQYTLDHLPEVLLNKISNKFLYPENDDIRNSDTLIREAIDEVYLQIDQNVPTEGQGGSTASIIFRLDDDNDDKVYAANVGDSQSFISIYDVESKKTKVMYITRKDKPDIPEERERIERSGGEVLIPLKKTSSSRTLNINPKDGKRRWVSMSRSIGDWGGKKLGMIASPIVDILSIDELLERYIKEEEETYINDNLRKRNKNAKKKEMLKLFAVSASDGMLDMITPERISRVIGSALSNDIEEEKEHYEYVYGYKKEDIESSFDSPHLVVRCEDLIIEAMHGWSAHSHRDDISISIVSFN